MMKTMVGMILFALLAPVWAQDDLVIRIEGGMEGAVPIAIVPFAWNVGSPPPAPSISEIIRADLRRTGMVAPLEERDLVERPSSVEQVRFGTWRLLQTDYLLLGEVVSRGGGWEVEVQLVNVLNESVLFHLAYPTSVERLRYTAHHIADRVFEELFDIPGAFRTKIAYVTASGLGADRSFALMVADSDGYGPQQVLRSAQPILSPAWAPDGRSLAYVSFEGGNSAIYLHDLYSGERTQLTDFKGINGAPSFSPGGRKLALTLSMSGSPEIYVMDLATRDLNRLTSHWAIDTEPRFTPDGRSILFTSDRAGKPQIYEIPVGGGEPRRVTRRGEYNARVSVGPDGDRLAMVTGEGNVYRIAILNRQRDEWRVISDGPLDESPSLAPNGAMVLYATREGERGVLYARPILGGSTARQRILFADGDIREPTWSPIF